MELRIKERLTPALLHEIAGRYGLSSDQLKPLGSWQNFVYRFEREGRGYILRITHDSHRSPAMIASELDFVSYLAENGVDASRPAGPVEQAGEFTAAVFTEAPGSPPGPEVDMWHVLRSVGRLTGRIHRLSRSYRPSPGIAARFAWHESDYLREMLRYLPADQPGVHAAYARLLERLRALPTGDESAYGLIHGDIVRGNFFWHEGRPFIFDFDEAQYCWYVNDIAIHLFYAIPFPSDDREEMAARFMHEWFEGYSQEFTLDRAWLKQIPLFLRLRQLVLYAALLRSADLSKLSPWGQRFMAFARTNLAADEPVFDFDFGA